VLTVEEGIREVDKYQLSSTEVRLDILCSWAKERVKEIKTKLNHCLLHRVQFLVFDKALELWFSSATRTTLDR
jgi:hypothetical protein